MHDMTGVGTKTMEEKVFITTKLGFVNKDGEIASRDDSFDVTMYDTEDLIHDYNLMLFDFGDKDETVVEYKQELSRRGVAV